MTAIHEYQSIMNRYGLYVWNQNVSTTVGQPINCEIAGYYVMTDDECHEVLSPRNITCSGSVPALRFNCIRLVAETCMKGAHA